MRNLSLREPAVLVAVALVMVGALLTWFSLASVRQRHSTEQAVHYASTAIGDLYGLQTQIATAVAAQRGFLLTRQQQYLRRYQAALASAGAVAGSLRHAMSGPNGHAEETAQLATVESALQRELDKLRVQVQQAEAGDAQAALAGVRADADQKPLMLLQAGVDRLISDERARLRAWLAEWTRRQRIGATITTIGAGFALLVALAAAILALSYTRANQAAQRRLQHARDMAVTANRAKSRLLATASHDLRQPLHAMNLFISVLQRRAGDEEMKQIAASLASAVESMQGMFNALLDISKLDAGVVTPSIRSFALEEVLGRLRHAFEGPADARGLVLAMPSSTAVLRSDPVLLESILRNLISNAIRYTARGSVTVQCRLHAASAELAVQDTGPGIPADQIERAFEEFQRLPGPRGSERGLGLGLSIVRRLGELLNIPIDVRSELGAGTVFTVRVPLAFEHVQNRAEPDSAFVPMQGRRVLLVDDDPLIRAALAKELRDWGAEPIVADSAEAALAGVGQTAPDVAVLDRDLGGDATGPQLWDMLVARFGPLPAIIVTGATDPDALAECRRRALPLMTKPLDANQLRRKMGELLR